MGIAEDIKNHSNSTFTTQWDRRRGNIVPSSGDIKLNNDAVEFNSAVILYADLDQSTSLVDNYDWTFAAEVYKTFLYAASRLIRLAGGAIVSYDGDRVMAVFIGSSPCNDAVRCALKINHAVKRIIQPELDAFYKNNYKIRHVVGIDKSEVKAARAGVRGDNDLVWVGTAANLAAKLTALDAAQPTYITQRVYDALKDPLIYSDGKSMWKEWSWVQHNSEPIWSTIYRMSF